MFVKPIAEFKSKKDSPFSEFLKLFLSYPRIRQLIVFFWFTQSLFFLLYYCLGVIFQYHLFYSSLDLSRTLNLNLNYLYLYLYLFSTLFFFGLTYGLNSLIRYYCCKFIYDHLLIKMVCSNHNIHLQDPSYSYGEVTVKVYELCEIIVKGTGYLLHLLSVIIYCFCTMPINFVLRLFFGILTLSFILFVSSTMVRSWNQEIEVNCKRTGQPYFKSAETYMDSKDLTLKNNYAKRVKRDLDKKWSSYYYWEHRNCLMYTYESWTLYSSRVIERLFGFILEFTALFLVKDLTCFKNIESGMLINMISHFINFDLRPMIDLWTKLSFVSTESLEIYNNHRNEAIIDLQDQNKKPLRNLFVKNLSYSYEGNQKLFSKLNLDLIKPHTLICGDSGTGKSTLFLILSGHIPTQNCIYDENQKPINSEHLKSMVYLLDQQVDCYENPFTVRQNLNYFQDHTDSELHLLLERSNLKHISLDAVMQPQLFSGGELKRFNFARMLADLNSKTHSIILIDELLTGLDHYNKNLLLNQILELASCYRIVWITQDNEIISLLETQNTTVLDLNAFN